MLEIFSAVLGFVSSIEGLKSDFCVLSRDPNFISGSCTVLGCYSNVKLLLYSYSGLILCDRANI